MKGIIVGSYAAYKQGVLGRKPVDIDVWLLKGQSLESSLPDTYRRDISYLPESVISLIDVVDDCASPDDLYTIKMSHLGWENPMWWKHLQDLLVMGKKGCEIKEDLYKALLDHWKVELGNKPFLSLDKSKECFFTDHVDYVYEHDMLHEVIVKPNKPTYQLCLKDDQEVLIDRGKFDELPRWLQISMFMEEITAIAIERWWLNPYWEQRGMTILKAHQLALRKTITSLTKGWASDFILRSVEDYLKPDYTLYYNAAWQLKRVDKMSKVDLTLFKELEEELELTTGLKFLVWLMCEGEVPFGNTYEFVNKAPTYGLRQEKPNLYESMLSLYRKEKDSKWQQHVNALEEKYGYEHLEQEGGGEGGSGYCYGVFKLGGKVYKAEYSYYSYSGDDYDDILETLREVTPRQKTITIYE